MGTSHLDSCHHSTWLCNIPRGQFICIRCNCALDSDYQAQSQVLEKRFFQKGYQREQVNVDRDKIGILKLFLITYSIGSLSRLFWNIGKFLGRIGFWVQFSLIAPNLSIDEHQLCKMPLHLEWSIHLSLEKIGFFLSYRVFMPVVGAQHANNVNVISKSIKNLSLTLLAGSIRSKTWNMQHTRGGLYAGVKMWTPVYW